MAILIENATVLTMAPGSGTRPIESSILIEDGSIAEVGTDLTARPGDTVISGRDRLVVPGFVNGHTHSWEALFRGRYDNLPLELWMLLAYPIIGSAPLPPDLIRLRTLLVAIESLKSGVTCLVDDVLETPAQDHDQLAAVFDAYAEAGIRANISGHIINRPFTDTLPYTEGTVPRQLIEQVRALPLPTARDYMDFSAEAFQRFDGAAQGRLRYMVAPSGPQRCTDDLLAETAELARRHSAQCHIHVLETKTQMVTGREFYGTTMVEHLHRLGALGHNTTLAHGIWVTNKDIDLLAETRTSVSHNPISNLKLGSGIAPWRAFHNAGVNVALGSDGMSSSDSARMLDVIKAAGLLHKVSTPDHTAWPTTEEVLSAATLGGARSALLEDKIGSVEEGKRADLVMYDTTTLAFTPRNELDRHLVYAENGSSIDMVMVDGEIVVDKGQVTSVNEEQILAEVRDRTGEIQEWQRRVETRNQVFHPGFEAVYRRCAAEPMGINRYAEN
ncbi:amidohydrolase family protein [Nocardiopsis sp. NPDC006938]|uniref:amidohydrolase family protein n=1 Tax=Nocardiopsis sp. NPDC006938 TaxID=3364337 RepID=UPI0036C25292